MITIKYEKRNPAIYISHIDMLRGMARIIRRTGYTPEFSKGFNPHMLVFFSPPLAVGVSSLTEYVTIDIKGVDAIEFLNAFNKSAPQGIKGIASYYTEKSPNLAGNIVAADYYYPIKNGVNASLLCNQLLTCSNYVIEYMQKNELVKKDVRSMIYDAKPYNDGIVLTLATGNTNLRADRLLPRLKSDFNIDTEVTDILKIKMFLNVENKYANADDILSKEICD